MPAGPYLGGYCGERTNPHSSPSTHVFVQATAGQVPALCATNTVCTDTASDQPLTLCITRLLLQSFVWGKSFWSSAHENVSAYACNVPTHFQSKYPSATRPRVSPVVCPTNRATSMCKGHRSLILKQDTANSLKARSHLPCLPLTGLT